jgi:hypothetical protein
MKRYKLILKELAQHIPFTTFGAFTGIVIMAIVVFFNVSSGTSNTIFYVLHPVHIVLSALVTTAIYRKHGGKLITTILIGYIGSIGIATVSDVIFPYFGGTLLGAEMEFHMGFIEKWWLVNPLAFVGIAIGYLRPTTKVPHAGHVLLSTWASLFYLAAFGMADWLPLIPLAFFILFIAVWFPCCLSDIIFPLLFVRNNKLNKKQNKEEVMYV